MVAICILAEADRERKQKCVSGRERSGNDEKTKAKALKEQKVTQIQQGIASPPSLSKPAIAGFRH